MNDLEPLRSGLLAWFDAHKRDLPWRHTRDPYRILLSEVLLQQTQVSRGLVYYARFLEAFPTVQALAAALVEAVLKAWEGAGYYARARNLHRAAQAMAERGVPRTLEGLMALPGVGRYTAGAVASIAFGLPVPVVDGNVRRVLARWFAQPHPGEDWLWTQAETLLDPTRPGDWNQALMELGATVCLPKSPRCPECPVSAHCDAFRTGRASSIPAPKARAAVKTVRAVAVVAHANGRYLLEQRPAKGLLGGLHGFPLEPVAPGEQDETAALERLTARLGLRDRPAFRGAVSHTMTHRQLEVRVHAVALERDPDPGFGTLERPADVALSRLDQKILAVAYPGPLFA